MTDSHPDPRVSQNCGPGGSLALRTRKQIHATYIHILQSHFLDAALVHILQYDSYIFIMIMHKHILWNVELVRSTEPMPKRTVINESKGPIVQRSDDITAEYTLE